MIEPGHDLSDDDIAALREMPFAELAALFRVISGEMDLYGVAPGEIADGRDFVLDRIGLEASDLDRALN